MEGSKFKQVRFMFILDVHHPDPADPNPDPDPDPIPGRNQDHHSDFYFPTPITIVKLFRFKHLQAAKNNNNYNN